MNDSSMDVLSTRPRAAEDRVPTPHTDDAGTWLVPADALSRDGGRPTAGLLSTGPRPAPLRDALQPRREAGGPGGMVPSDDDLVERTLAFSGSYVTDDGHVTIRRSLVRSREYSGDRFTGYCDACARARLISPAGEVLSELRAVLDFLATHDHGETD